METSGLRRLAHWVVASLALASAALGLSLLPAGANSALAADPVALRAESFLVPPPAGPLAYVAIQNLQTAPWRGTVAYQGPEGWRIVPAQREVELKPGELGRVQFAVERGLLAEANSYPVQVSATGGASTVVRRQNVAAATAPFFKPNLDGDPSEWKDALPVTFTTGGKKTVISTYWNRQQFCILVAVEEDKLVGYQESPGPRGFDAVQVAVSPQGSKTGASPDEDATRYEFLFASSSRGSEAKGFRLAEPGMKLGETQKDRPLASLAYDQAKAAVSRTGGVTYYECGIPFAPMRQEIRPSEGREFCLSVLVHDPDGTGIRDWGEAAGLWPWQRNRLAWSRWQGAVWGEQAPFDNKLEWGLCASKY